MITVMRDSIMARLRKEVARLSSVDRIFLLDYIQLNEAETKEYLLVANKNVKDSVNRVTGRDKGHQCFGVSIRFWHSKVE